MDRAQRCSFTATGCGKRPFDEVAGIKEEHDQNARTLEMAIELNQAAVIAYLDEVLDAFSE
jgi:hypothetical protein